MAKPSKWTSTLQASQEEALLAVKLYNDPSEVRSFEGFIVHMHLAWLYLLHAHFIRGGVDFRYRMRNNPRRLERVDGEVKRWELAACVKYHRPAENDPTRKNIEFFIALRNKIEHRHSKFDKYLALATGGKAQALLRNYDAERTALFGDQFSLATTLGFPLFIGTFTEEGTITLKELRDRLPTDLKQFIAEFHSGLSTELEDDPRFELRLRVVLERVNRDPDALAMQFTHWDDMTDEEKAAVDALGKKGQLVVRERTRSIAGDGLLKLTEVAAQVAESIPFVFTNHHAVSSWRVQRIRPGGDDPNPQRTDERYCIYFAITNTYGYTEAWVEKCVRKCSTREGFEEFTGCEAKLKPAPHDDAASTTSHPTPSGPRGFQDPPSPSSTYVTT